MSIYLDNQTRSYLYYLLKKRLETNPKDFIAKRLLSSVSAEYNELREISQCQHKAAHYVGRKSCCVYCGSFFEPGMGMSWDYNGVERLGKKTPTTSTLG